MIEIGTLLQDRFLVEEQIGVGGMGAVYRAVDQKFGTNVAIKETFYSDKDLGEAFEREARLLNGLHHPLFPHVSDHFVEGNGHFLIMEYIEGEDLSTLLKRGERFPFETVMRWTLDLLDGLDYLHSQNPPIIHRDVKPSNLKLTPRGNLLLLDFGMAKETSGDTQGMQSVFGYSRRYSPLEQIEGTGTDVRSDIFSLGATVYHLLTGAPPVDVLARASAIVAGKPDPLKLASEIDSNVPELIAALIHSALALNPDKRFVSARAMWNSVEEALRVGESPESAVSATPITPAVIRQEETFPALEAFEEDFDLNSTAAPAASIFRNVSDDEADPMAALIAQRVAQMKAADVLDPGVVFDEPARIEIPVTKVPEPIESVQELDSADLPANEPDFDNEPQPEYEELPNTNVWHPVPQSNRNRLILWVPAILLVFGLLAYGLYRSGTAETADQNTSASQPETLEQTVPVDSEVNTPGKTSLKNKADQLDTPKDRSIAAETNTSMNSVSTKPVGEAEKRLALSAAQNSARKNTPAKSESKTTPRAKPGVDSAVNRSNRATRPRVVRSATNNEPPVSSIDSILTGDPAYRPSRWEVWEEDYLRRQRRLRRIMRQNRQYPPY
ncbi:MAG: serine/threonine protein kinase [Pyrinomonadaceae bacterium]